MSAALVALDDIKAAAERIRGAAVRTPLIEMNRPRRGGPPAPSFMLKCENFQPMGAFKIRGAYNMLAQLAPHRAGVRGGDPAGSAEARAAGVITYSSGNHGQAVAIAAQSLGIRAVVVMPPGDLTFAHAQALVDEIVTVTDEAIASAVKWLFEQVRLVAEPSGAASVAAVLQAGASIVPGTVAVVSGGNVAPDDFVRYIRQ